MNLLSFSAFSLGAEKLGDRWGRCFVNSVDGEMKQLKIKDKSGSFRFFLLIRSNFLPPFYYPIIFPIFIIKDVKTHYRQQTMYFNVSLIT